LWLLCQNAQEMSETMQDLVCEIVEQLDREMVERMGKGA